MWIDLALAVHAAAAHGRAEVGEGRREADRAGVRLDESQRLLLRSMILLLLRSTIKLLLWSTIQVLLLSESQRQLGLKRGRSWRMERRRPPEVRSC